MPKSRYLDFDVLARIDSMQLLAKVVVEGFILGLHRSPYRGFSVEFAEYRQYSPGDEIKHVDWKVYGKTDRYYVKQFEEETNLTCYILLDASASMSYRSKEEGPTKLEYASYMAACLSYFIDAPARRDGSRDIRLEGADDPAAAPPPVASAADTLRARGPQARRRHQHLRPHPRPRREPEAPGSRDTDLGPS